MFSPQRSSLQPLPGRRRNPVVAVVLFTMKMIAEYLEHALNFEHMAAEEKNPPLKAAFEKQAAAYRKLAAERTEKLGLAPPEI